MLRRAFVGGLAVALLAFLALVAMGATPAAAATPLRIVVSGGGLSGPIVIAWDRSDERTAWDGNALVGGLCPDDREEHAGGLAARPRLSIAIEWADSPDGQTDAWLGAFYSGVGGRPAVADIPDWTMYTSVWPSPRFCDRRVVGAEALAVLARHGVPTDAVAPALLPAAGSGGGPTRSAAPWVRLEVPAALVVAAGAGARYLIRKKS